MNGRPRCAEVTHNSLTVDWDRPKFSFPVPSHYEVYNRKSSDSETSKCVTTENGTCSFTIKNLPMNTKFVVRVSACYETKQGPLSDESSVMSTLNVAYKMKDESTVRLETLPSSIPVYDVPCLVERDEKLKINTITISM